MDATVGQTTVTSSAHATPMTINPTEHPTIDAISGRWSPYRFEPRPIETSLLSQCFEAARWASSSFNEQPWRWIVATRDQDDEFIRAVNCLMEANRPWASNAGALVLTAYRAKFSRNDKPNRVALHDLGQAASLLSIQAAALGLQVHQMAGINLSQIRAEYQIPEEFEPATAIAIGYPSTQPADSPEAEQMVQRERAARKRNPLSEQLFTGVWGGAVPWS
ncbi:MAG: nitroreductase family protein [Planctomycetota bacterium]